MADIRSLMEWDVDSYGILNFIRKDNKLYRLLDVCNKMEKLPENIDIFMFDLAKDLSDIFEVRMNKNIYTIKKNDLTYHMNYFLFFRHYFYSFVTRWNLSENTRKIMLSEQKNKIYVEIFS